MDTKGNTLKSSMYHLRAYLRKTNFIRISTKTMFLSVTSSLSLEFVQNFLLTTFSARIFEVIQEK